MITFGPLVNQLAGPSVKLKLPVSDDIVRFAHERTGTAHRSPRRRRHAFHRRNRRAPELLAALVYTSRRRRGRADGAARGGGLARRGAGCLACPAEAVRRRLVAPDRLG